MVEKEVKKSRAKVRIGLPKKQRSRAKVQELDVPPKLRSLVESTYSKWDDNTTVIHNYKSFGFVSNPNLLGVRSRTSHIIQRDSLQLPPSALSPGEVDPSLDSGSDLEEAEQGWKTGSTPTFNCDAATTHSAINRQVRR